LQVGECACCLPQLIALDPRRALRDHQKPNLAPVVVASFCQGPEQYDHEDPSYPGDDGHARKRKRTGPAGHFVFSRRLVPTGNARCREQFADMLGRR
jgi:hypothetical protein